MSDLLSDVIKKAIEVSEKTKHDVFIYYYPHVKSFEIDIHLNGWSEDKNADLHIKTYLNAENTSKVLEQMKKELNQLIDEEE